MTQAKNYRIGWMSFLIGAVLVLICLVGYGWPLVSVLLGGPPEWADWFLISVGRKKIDIGPAAVGTLGGLFLYVGKRLRNDAYSLQHALLTTLAEKARETGSREDLESFETEKAVFLRFDRLELGYLYVVSGFNLMLVAILVVGAIWSYVEGFEYYWVLAGLGAFMIFRTWLDWPERHPAKG